MHFSQCFYAETRQEEDKRLKWTMNVNDIFFFLCSKNVFNHCSCRLYSLKDWHARPSHTLAAAAAAFRAANDSKAPILLYFIYSLSKTQINYLFTTPNSMRYQVQPWQRAAICLSAWGDEEEKCQCSFSFLWDDSAGCGDGDSAAVKAGLVGEQQTVGPPTLHECCWARASRYWAWALVRINTGFMPSACGCLHHCRLHWLTVTENFPRAQPVVNMYSGHQDALYWSGNVALFCLNRVIFWWWWYIREAVAHLHIF